MITRSRTAAELLVVIVLFARGGILGGLERLAAPMLRKKRNGGQP